MNTRQTIMRASLVAMAALTSTLADARDASACACCADDGLRIEGSETLTSNDKVELERVRFSTTAKLYVSAGEPEDYAKGIRDPADKYTLTVARKADQFTLTLRDSKGKAGTLVFATPKTVERFFIDPRDGKTSGAGGPLLYKELRFRAPLTGTGIFEPGMAGGATARLVLQGRGNVCSEAEQFTNWTLVVSGPKASYTLFGALSAPAKRP